MALSEQLIEQLEALLFSDQLAEEALDFFGLHGLICASVVGPLEITKPDIVQIVFGLESLPFNKAELSLFDDYINIISSTIKESLLEGREIDLPYSEEANNEDNSHYDACIESWCAGFIEGFFHAEKNWFSRGEDITAELLLPIMALSGLFDSDEFMMIRDNEKLMSQFEEIMPDQLVDIFLFFHSD